MGTRADFYVGRGERAEWVGSIAWDGDWIPDNVAKAKTEKTYRKNVTKFFETRDDASLPADGWPWPWDDSNTTDVSYAFDGGRVYRAIGYPVMYWWRADHTHPYYREEEGGTAHRGKVAAFPSMKKHKKVTFGDRSGLITVGV